MFTLVKIKVLEILFLNKIGTIGTYQKRFNFFRLIFSSLPQTLSYLIKGSLGIGVMGMDEAFKHAGLWTSLGLSLVIVLLVYYTAWVSAACV